MGVWGSCDEGESPMRGEWLSLGRNLREHTAMSVRKACGTRKHVQLVVQVCRCPTVNLKTQGPL